MYEFNWCIKSLAVKFDLVFFFKSFKWQNLNCIINSIPDLCNLLSNVEDPIICSGFWKIMIGTTCDGNVVMLYNKITSLVI